MEHQLQVRHDKQTMQSVHVPAYREEPHLLALPPDQMITRATSIANVLKKVIVEKRLTQNIKGKEHVLYEGWSTLGSLLGVTPREVDVTEHKDGSYTATVELFNWKTGQVVGRASALCGKEERRWNKADRYAVRSMAITRAAGKAYRQCFSWIITLAGFSGTPAEEMPLYQGQPVHQPVQQPVQTEYNPAVPTPEGVQPQPKKPRIFSKKDIGMAEVLEQRLSEAGIPKGEDAQNWKEISDLLDGEELVPGKIKEVAAMVVGKDKKS